MNYIKLFESNNNQRIFTNYSSTADIVSLFRDITIETTDNEINQISEYLLKINIPIISNNKYYFSINNYDSKTRKGDFIVSYLFFKIEDDWFICIDRKQDSDDYENQNHIEYFKCDQLYGFLNHLKDEFDGF